MSGVLYAARMPKTRAADLVGGGLHGRDLARRDLAGVRVAGAWGERIDVRGASLRGAEVTGGSWHDSDFSHTDLRGARFRGVALTTCNFSGAILDEDTRFEGCDLRGSRFPAGAERAFDAGCVAEFVQVGGRWIGPDPIEAGVPLEAISR